MVGKTMRRWMLTATAVLMCVSVTAACGGGKKNATKSTDAGTSDTSTTVVGDTSTTTGAGDTTTTVAATAGATTTTSKATTSKTTVKKGNVLTQATAPPPTVSGFANATTPSTTAPSEPPQSGGSVTLLEATEGAGLDPTLATGSIGGTDPQKLFAVYDALVYQEPSTGGIVPQTAESMTTTDGKVWALKIRPNIKFSDGTAYDAAAVKFNWDRCSAPTDATAKPCTNKSVVDSFSTSVASPLVLTITLKATNGQFPRLISANGALAYIGSPTAETAAGTQANYNTHPIGAGPFLFKEWIRDSTMTFVRNPTYWNAPRPFVDQVVFRPVVDEGQRTNSFKAGEAQLEYAPSLQNANDLAKTFPVLVVPSINAQITDFNSGKAPFNDLNVRKAIQLAVDLDGYNSTFFPGQPAPTGYFPPNYPYSDPSLQFPKPDLVKAQQLVNDYIAAHGGADITFTWTAASSTLAGQQAAFVQQNIQRLQHVKVTIKQEATQAIVNDLQTKNFDMIGLTMTGVDPEPQFFASIITGGTRNFMGYSNATVDKDIADSRAAVDSASRTAALKQLQKDALADVPLLIMNTNPTIWAQQPNIKDFAAFDEGGPLLDRVWIKSH